ncbi:hypothetical protein SteCoe_3035 [Stentor coeruleus]|uniref:Uncharacterized protein n=1 Tax=Stentor coeruleus TaxID=5963 RepID=A0A1R2CYB1_9CILI|nr:hypothetical protein SteCoe_3035 [Stentor coeruleus]
MPYEDTLYMIDSAIQPSVDSEKIFTYAAVIIVIIFFIPVVACLIGLCVICYRGKFNEQSNKDPLLAQDNNQVNPSPSQPYMSYVPSTNYGNYPPPPPPMYQAPEGDYPPPPVPQGAEHGFPEASSPPPPPPK